MNSPDKILIEVVYKAQHCLPCHYMDLAVREVMPKYAEKMEYRLVEFMKRQGRQRFLELSYSLFGKEAVHKHFRIAPVPSLFIDGELVFDAIPPRHELEEALDDALAAGGLSIE